MRHRSLLAAFGAALAVCALSSCAKEIEPEVRQEIRSPEDRPANALTYSLSIDASKGAEAPGTRVLTLEGSTLSATWAEGDTVSVYNETKEEELTGTLSAKSAGASTILEGELSGTKEIETGDILTLKFLSPDYDAQDGTLEYIAAHCDYATATVTVKSVTEDNKISTESAANFENQQAIVKFTLNIVNSVHRVFTKSMDLVIDDRIISVSPDNKVSDVYVAVPAVSEKRILIRADDYDNYGDKYYYVKSGATFESGKYYEITVAMKSGTVVYNEEELNDAVNANAPTIVLGCDIPLENYCGISADKDITLDLAGSTLSRSLSANDDYGSVIRVSTYGTLTIIDSSEGSAATRADDSSTSTGTGKITGGKATVGGGICNHGTLTLAGGTISGNNASAAGGGIYNAPSSVGGTPASFTMTGGSVEGNWGEDCGGVYNYEGSSITIEGGIISGNTSNKGGGGVVNYGEATITGGTIESNTATTRGGGIWNGGTLSMSNGVITHNTATISGGGIHNNSAGTLTITGGSIVTNYAVSGGGIMNEGGTASIIPREVAADMPQVSVRFNEVTGSGGGIWNSGTLTIGSDGAMTDISNNTCRGEGGGIYGDGTLNLKGKIQVASNMNSIGGLIKSNLYLPSGKTTNIVGKLYDSSGWKTNIGVYSENYKPQFVTNGYHSVTGYYNSRFFTADVDRMTVDYESNELLFKQMYTGEDPIRYIARSWENNTVVDKLSFAMAKSIVSVLEGDGETDLDGYYYVKDHVTTTDKLHAAGDVHLILCDDASLDANCLWTEDNTINIYGQSVGTGLFKATDPEDLYPGIGCHSRYSAGTVNIHGGFINVKGSDYCAGIGGSLWPSDDNTVVWHSYLSILRIYGGTVNATGGCCAAGLGGSSKTNYLGNIYIYNGTVYAQGGEDDSDMSGGAGIGAGYSCSDGGRIEIWGGTVVATGGDEAAGIGLGNDPDVYYTPNITFYGGNTTATGGEYGAGIGGGNGVIGCNLTVFGGNIWAHAGEDAAGIGSGKEAGKNKPLQEHNYGCNLKVRGGRIEAWGNGGGSGLGAGKDSALGTIEITGGTVIAHGSEDGKAICSHYFEDGSVNSLTFGKTMRLRISDTILSYQFRDPIYLYGFQDIQIEPCTHQGSPCDWCMKGH